MDATAQVWSLALLKLPVNCPQERERLQNWVKDNTASAERVKSKRKEKK